jgi:hypothetical protein
MKIKICAGWDSSENITKRLRDQSAIDSNNLNFVYDNSYDIIVYNNYVTEPPRTGSRAFLFFHEPSWSGSHQKSFSENITVFGFNSTSYSVPNGNLIEMPACMFYGGTGPDREGWDFWTYENLKSLSFNKTKNISSIISSLGKEGSYPYGCIYAERYNLLNSLVSDNFNYIDFYGYNLELSLKKDGLVDYKFSLCVENSNEKNYVSEKFYDCILTNTIPIYFGCNNIKEIWPFGGYFNIDDIRDTNTIKKLLLNIETNAETLYNTMLPDLLRIKKEYFQKYNILKVIENILK